MLTKTFLLISLLSLTNFAHGEFQCATGDFIQNLPKDQAINAAYLSGPSGGNYGNEVEYGGIETGIMFLTKEHTKGNLDVFEMYPSLNLDILQTKGTDEEKKITLNYPHHQAGLFKPTYSQDRDCRRQVFITDVVEGPKGEIYSAESTSGTFGVGKKSGDTRYFSGWLNVELCTPGARGIFYKAAEIFESQGKKVDSIQTFIGFVESTMWPQAQKVADDARAQLRELEDAENPDQEKIKTARAVYSTKMRQANGMNRLIGLLETNDPNVYYGKMPYLIGGKTVTGHIGPRFSIKMLKMYFVSNKEGDACRMNIFPSYDYAGLLSHEMHEFSEDIQSMAVREVEFEAEGYGYDDKVFQDGNSDYNGGNSFFMSYFSQGGKPGLRKPSINKSLNTPQ